MAGSGGGAPLAVPLPHHRLAKRRPGDRLRFLPLHLALEGYLALHFGGPPAAGGRVLGPAQGRCLMTSRKPPGNG